MDEKTDWADQYSRLQTKYEYSIVGQSLVPIKETTASGEDIIVDWEKTDGYPETDQSREEIDTEMQELLSNILEEKANKTATYKDQIQCLLHTVKCDIKNGRLADVVGCSKSYAARFEYNEDCRQVIEKDWSKEYQEKKVSPKTRDKVLERDHEQCRRCESTDNLQVHHIVPISAGGESHNHNLATLCEKCHKLAHGGSWTSPSVVYDEFETWIS